MTTSDSDIVLDRLMSLHPKIIDLTLDRVWRLLDALGNPQEKLAPVIHIAGTNGKGSTQAMLRAGLEGAGKKVQSYTSPHLARFHERIRLSEGLISEPDLIAVLEECEAANLGQAITYFEITTVAALLAFSRSPADYCILEVGLGGRLDATNVISNPAMTAITPVSLDHQQFLGDTLPKIAFEKTGILKNGSPCIVGPQDAEALEVIENHGHETGAPLTIFGQDFNTFEENGRLVFQDGMGLLDLPMPKLIGAHQVQNAGVTIAALRALGFGEEACQSALVDASWPARMERLKSGQLVELAKGHELWLDGGHNAAAGTALAQTLKSLPSKPVTLICGMLRTKDVSSFLEPLAPLVDGLTALSIPGETATLSAEETATAARREGMKAGIASDVRSAISSIAQTDENTRIVICGSLYLAGHVIRENT